MRESSAASSQLQTDITTLRKQHRQAPPYAISSSCPTALPFNNSCQQLCYLPLSRTQAISYRRLQPLAWCRTLLCSADCTVRAAHWMGKEQTHLLARAQTWSVQSLQTGYTACTLLAKAPYSAASCTLPLGDCAIRSDA